MRLDMDTCRLLYTDTCIHIWMLVSTNGNLLMTSISR